tara:strand:- start:3643 stop:4296 length:654 start_codon:yes stop_codon:yes gene_type:complete
MVKLVCLDRDGTINEDDNYKLGSKPYWKGQVKILNGVAEGIKRLNSEEGVEVFVVTNQSGVALQDEEFSDLTEERMDEVNDYILSVLSGEGVEVRGCFTCPFVDEAYVRRVGLAGRQVNPDYIREGYRDIKPNIGMLEKSARSIGKSLGEVSLYVVGDRKSDVQLGLNGGGKGILVSGVKTEELGDLEKVKTLRESHPGRVYIAKDFIDAVDYIIND